MPLQICSLNSGSNGNCYYVGNTNEAVLIDAGISCREIEKRLRNLSLDPQSIKALFISHEHSDHIRGVEVFLRKYRIPVYITAATLGKSGMQIDLSQCRIFRPYQQIEVGDLLITPFPKSHDAIDPHSFLVADEEVTVGVFTDIGFACEHVLKNFKLCHAVFLESNYDDKMLNEGNYPFYLRKRIQSNEGHLSNHQALELFVNHRPSFMTQVLLSHLSQDNNDPALALDMFMPHAGNASVSVASRQQESPVFTVSSVGSKTSHETEDAFSSRGNQLNLFG